MITTTESGALSLLQRQRSHILLVLSNALDGEEQTCREWYRSRTYVEAILRNAGVLSMTQYVQHEVDITCGHFARPPFQYLGICELSIDGAQEAQALIQAVHRMHREQKAVQDPATWLYYPTCEKVGRPPVIVPSLLTIAFANGLAGQDEEFTEFYATRHIRHALNISALVSGQVFKRTLVQSPGAMEAEFKLVAIYEQECEPAVFLKQAAELPDSVVEFPTLDLSRFAEASFRPI